MKKLTPAERYASRATQAENVLSSVHLDRPRYMASHLDVSAAEINSDGNLHLHERVLFPVEAIELLRFLTENYTPRSLHNRPLKPTSGKAR